MRKQGCSPALLNLAAKRAGEPHCWYGVKRVSATPLKNAIRVQNQLVTLLSGGVIVGSNSRRAARLAKRLEVNPVQGVIAARRYRVG
jgi:hypothetical protein